MERIVVGVDRSEGAAVALAWALKVGEETGAVVEALHAYQLPYGWIDNGFGPDMEAWEQEARVEARRELDRVVDGVIAGHPDYVEVIRTVVESAPARALIDASKGADLLVVGTRGRGGFAGLLIGSVSQQCVHHSRCPVVVVPNWES
jgi:nucleotide-binding universal stress UspA family protein